MSLPANVKTIRDLARAKLAVEAVCQRCRHRHLFFPLDLAARVGDGNFPISELTQRLRCTSCRARGWVSLQPSVRDEQSW